jgi:hypothetical protein
MPPYRATGAGLGGLGGCNGPLIIALCGQLEALHRTLTTMGLMLGWRAGASAMAVIVQYKHQRSLTVTVKILNIVMSK